MKDELPIIQKTFDMLVWLVPKIEQFPRKQKFLLGDRIERTALDFLGFGLPPPTPSWGELLHQGSQNLFEWHLVLFPLLAIFLTLQLTVFIGEAVRESFDPRVFNRLR